MTKEELKKEAEEKCVCTDEAMRIMYGIGYIDGAEPREKRIVELENQIADIKANCDLAIEGRDIKIKELEKENKKLEEDFRVCEKNADTYYDQLTNAKEIIKKLIYAYYHPVITKGDEERRCVILDEAKQFLKEE